MLPYISEVFMSAIISETMSTPAAKSGSITPASPQLFIEAVNAYQKTEAAQSRS
jgi:hypothetical protein